MVFCFLVTRDDTGSSHRRPHGVAVGKEGTVQPGSRLSEVLAGLSLLEGVNYLKIRIVALSFSTTHKVKLKQRDGGRYH